MRLVTMALDWIVIVTIDVRIGISLDFIKCEIRWVKNEFNLESLKSAPRILDSVNYENMLKGK